MKAIFALFLSLFLLTFNVSLLLNFYLPTAYEDNHYKITLMILNYISSKGDIDNKFFTENEISHLNDVKALIKNIIILRDFSLVAIIFFASYFVVAKKTKIILESLFLSGISIFIFSTIITLFSLISFKTFFIFFHKILFPKGNWSFPKESILIRLFSEMYFFEATLHLVLLMFIESTILLSFFLIYKKYKKT